MKLTHPLVILVLFLWGLSGCTMPSKKGMKLRDSETVYRGANSSRFILSDIPLWASFSETGQCYKNMPIRFLNFEQIQGHFGLSYKQSVQFQLMYNLEIEKKKEENTKVGTSGQLTLSDEDNIFYQVLDKASANFQAFRPPAFKRVNIIWIDHVLEDAVLVARLKQLLRNEVLDSGHPVFVSLCLGQAQMEKKLNEWGVGHIDLRLMSAEMMNVYNQEMKPTFFNAIKLEEFFENDQDLYFYTPTTAIPRAFENKRLKVEKY